MINKQLIKYKNLPSKLSLDSWKDTQTLGTVLQYKVTGPFKYCHGKLSVIILYKNIIVHTKQKC